LAPSRSLPGLARYRAGLRGLPTAPRRHRPSLAEEPESCGPSGLGSPTERSLLPWSNSTSSRGIRPAVRSETAAFAAARSGRRIPLHRPPFRASASRVSTCRASTPAHVAARFGPEEPSSRSCSVPVVSHHLDGFLRSEVAGLLHPAAGHGVRRVSGAGFPIRDLASQIPAGGPTPSSRRTSHPPKASSTAAVPRHRGRCPRAVGRHPARPVEPSPLPAPSLRAPPDRSLDFEAFLRCRVWAPRGRFQSRCTRPSMGFVPLRGPSRSAAGTHADDRGAADDENPKKTVRISNKLRSAPAASVRCRPRPALLAEGEHGGDACDPIRRPDCGHLAQTPSPFRRTAPAGKHRPARRRSTPRSRSVSRHEDERGRVPEAVGIPSAVHRGSVGYRSSRA